jgi:hypothetical protein
VVEQETLRRLLLESVSARGYALEDVATFADGRWQAREVASETSALVILRSFDPEEYLQGATAFVTGLDSDAREAWYRAFTRTSFLVGDPDRIPDRFAHLLTHRTASIAWVWSSSDRATLGLRRLLKPLRTAGFVPPDGSHEYALAAGAGARHELCVATEDLALEDYLVHLNHTLCECLITGVLSTGDRVAIRHVARIESLPPRCSYARVVPDPLNTADLKAVSWVSPA